MGDGLLRGTSVLYLTVGHFSNAPRVQKAAAAAKDAGARVRVLGVCWEQSRVDEDASLASSIGVEHGYVADMRACKGNLLDRARSRAFREAYRRFGLRSAWALGPGAHRMLAAVRAAKPSLVMAHSEQSLWVAERLMRDGVRVGVDFEDWFSRDLLEADRRDRDVATLSELENALLQHAAVTFTTTHAMAAAMSHASGGARPPIVIPNSFPWVPDVSQLSFEGDRRAGPPSFYWYSQTIGPGRGLELLADALSALRGDWQLAVRGDIRGNRRWWDTHFGRHAGKVRLLSRVDNSQLSAAGAIHDVGLALELPYCDNKKYTASNKIFEYMRSGLCVVATATQGQQEVMAASPGAGRLVDPTDASALANALQELIDDPGRLAQAKAAAVAAARSTWDWNLHAPRLIEGYAAALGRQA